MSLFWNREKEVRRLIEEYFKAVDAAMAEFDRAMAHYVEQGSGDAFRAIDKAIHQNESRADDLRWEVEQLLYSRSLLPESRGDILGLLENFDHIPNLAENITYQIDTQCVVIPAALHPQLRQLVKANLEAYRFVRQAVDFLFTDPSRVGTEVKPVDEKESESDGLERDMIIALFRSEVPRADCILVRDVIQRIGDISDTCEKLARRLDIISLKKRI